MFFSLEMGYVSTPWRNLEANVHRQVRCVLPSGVRSLGNSERFLVLAVAKPNDNLCPFQNQQERLQIASRRDSFFAQLRSETAKSLRYSCREDKGAGVPEGMKGWVSGWAQGPLLTFQHFLLPPGWVALAQSSSSVGFPGNGRLVFKGLYKGP